jgi:hypothetical protein
MLQSVGLLEVNALDRLREDGAQLPRRASADHGRERRVRALLDPDGSLADLERVERIPFLPAERVVNEVTDRREHPGNHVRVLDPGRRRGDVLEQEARLPVNEKDLLDAVHEGAEEDHLGEWLPRPPRFHPPPDPLDREAVLERLAERLDHRRERARDRLPDRRTHDRKERVHEDLRVPPDGSHDRLFHRRLEDLRQGVVLGRAEDHCLREHAAHVLRVNLGVVETLLDPGDLGFLGDEEEPAQLPERIRCGGGTLRPLASVALLGRFVHRQDPSFPGSIQRSCNQRRKEAGSEIIPFPASCRS